MNSFEWTQLPEYLIGNAPIGIVSPKGTLGHGLTGGISSIGRSMCDAVDKTAHTPESLLVFLHTHIYNSQMAYKRSHIWWGRFYNKYSGANPYYIKLKSLHFIQALKVINKATIDSEIPVNADCAIRLDIALKILDELKTHLAIQPE